MKALNTVVKVLTALAAVAGAVYVVATYGDKIVTWAKNLWAKMPQCPACEEASEEAVAEEVVEVAEEPASGEPTAEEAAAEEAAPEAVVADNEPVAEEADFAE